MDRKKVIRDLHDLRRYLEDKEWSNSPDKRLKDYIDAVIQAEIILKKEDNNNGN